MPTLADSGWLRLKDADTNQKSWPLTYRGDKSEEERASNSIYRQGHKTLVIELARLQLGR